MRTMLLIAVIAALSARGQPVEGAQDQSAPQPANVKDSDRSQAVGKPSAETGGSKDTEAERATRGLAGESMQLLKDRFPYQPAVHEEAEVKTEIAGDVVSMERIVVFDSRAQRDFRKKMESDSQRIKEEQFSFLKGGVWLKNERSEVGLWSDSPDLKLFAEDAKFTDKKPVAKFGLLHLKF